MYRCRFASIEISAVSSTVAPSSGSATEEYTQTVLARTKRFSEFAFAASSALSVPPMFVSTAPAGSRATSFTSA